MTLTIMSDFTFKHVNQADQVSGDPATFKTNMDSQPNAIRDYMNGTLKTEVDAKANKAQEAWIVPTLLNGWVTSSGGLMRGYYKDEFGVVGIYFRCSGGTTAANTTLCQLPVGYRPSVTIQSLADTNSTTTDHKVIPVNIGNDGAVNIGENPSLGWLTVNATFRAE